MSSKGKILVVDDQKSIRDMLADLFAAAGYETTLAENGAEGIRLAEEVRPNVIVMDLMMPVKNGLEAVQELRAHPELASVPVLFLTARGQAQDEKRAREAGGNGFIAKPFSPRQVLAKVQELLAGN